MTDDKIIKAFDILDKFEFFGGQRAGRELWFDKPADIQEKDIGGFLRDIDFLKQFIDRQQAEYEDLQEQFRHLDIECERLEKANESQKAEIERLKEEISKARRKALLEAKGKFAGHSDYHGDTILCKLICMAEGKEVGVAEPLNKSKIKSEARKEFAENIKKDLFLIRKECRKFLENDGVFAIDKAIRKIDNLVKEMED